METGTRASVAPLSACPPELILMIGELLNVRDLSVLIRTAKRFWKILSARLYDLAVGHKCRGVDQVINIAARRGHTSVIQELIQRKADLKVEDWRGWSPLDNAAANGRQGVCEQLLDAGVDIRGTPEHGVTPLMLAAEHGHDSMVRFLLDRGADPSHMDKYEAKALHLSTTSITLQLLLEAGGCDISDVDNLQQTVLFYAVSDGHASVVQALLDKGVDVFKRNIFGDTALHVVQKGDIARMLLDAGADVSLRNDVGDTPLSKYRDSLLDTSELFRVLLSAGADVNGSDSGGTTALHRVVRSGDVEAAKVLVEAGADTCTEDYNGNQPWYIAIENGHIDMVEALLSTGVSVSAWCRKSGERKGTTALHLAAEHHHHEILRLLLVAGADVSAVNSVGSTPLSWTVGNDVYDRDREATVTLQMLLDAGASVLAADNRKWQPLHLAIFRRNIPVARLLLEAGADIAASTREGSTALHLAAYIGFQDMVELLLENGGDISSKDNEGLTPVAYASIGNHLCLLDFFVQRGAQDSFEWVNIEDGEWIKVLSGSPLIALRKARRRERAGHLYC